MLDLALALVWTPAGIAALVAVVVALLALAYAPRLALPAALVGVFLARVAYVSHLQDAVATTRGERDEAAALAEVRKAAVEALQLNTRAIANRTAATASLHERIRRAPASDDGPVAPVLRDVLEAGQWPAPSPSPCWHSPLVAASMPPVHSPRSPTSSCIARARPHGAAAAPSATSPATSSIGEPPTAIAPASSARSAPWRGRAHDAGRPAGPGLPRAGAGAPRRFRRPTSAPGRARPRGACPPGRRRRREGRSRPPSPETPVSVTVAFVVGMLIGLCLAEPPRRPPWRSA